MGMAYTRILGNVSMLASAFLLEYGLALGVSMLYVGNSEGSNPKFRRGCNPQRVLEARRMPNSGLLSLWLYFRMIALVRNQKGIE